MEIKPVDRGGVKRLWTNIRNLLESETAGFVTKDDIGPYKWGTLRELGNKSADYTFSTFNVGEITPVSVTISNGALYLPSGGKYFVMSGGLYDSDSRRMVMVNSGIYSGGSSLGTGHTAYILKIHGFILRLS